MMLFLFFTFASAFLSVGVLSSTRTNPRSAFLKEILSGSHYPSHNTIPTPPHIPLKVGIIGAGAAGLYSALLLDSLAIDYDILEADDRVGGRIYTYRFNQTAWDASTPNDPDYYDYYDVGAMRFPGMEYMHRIIGNANNSLIPYINSHVNKTRDKVHQIKYIFTANNTFRFFNDILQYNQITPTADIFDAEVSDNGTVDATFAQLNPSKVWGNVTSNFTTALSKNFTDGFNLLMAVDGQSIRSYLISQGYTGEQVDWMETINDATDHYDTYSMSQGVLEQWVFTEANLSSWTAINGGMDRLINGMLQVIKKKPIMNAPVSQIKPGNDQIRLGYSKNKTAYYAHVISTIPLGALQTVDLSELDIDYAQRHAIRKLQYDPALKIGIKFKTRWWEHLPAPFQGGQSYSDLPIRRCVYPSYGNHLPNNTAPGTMIASYVWGQDSSRLGAHLRTPEAHARLVDIVIQDLATMNNLTYGFLKDQYVDSHAWDWYASEWSVGAFAIFSPDQYSKVMPALMVPAEKGHVHWGGEALSSGHAWIIGAVNSAYRCVAEILKAEGRDDLVKKLVEKWGEIEEVDMGWYSSGS